MTDARSVRGALGAALLLLSCCAAAVEQRGVADVEYGRFLGREERAQALQDAFRNAVETWVADRQQSQYGNYRRMKREIDRNIEDYVLSHQVIREEQDKRNGRYRVVVRTELNEPRLLEALLIPSEVATGAEDAYLTFVFVAREQVGTESRTEREATQEKSRTQAIERERGEDRAGQTRTQTETVSVRRAERDLQDRVLWDVATVNEIDSAMGEVFTDARYLVIDASLVGDDQGNTLDVEQFLEDYREGDDVRPATRRAAYRTLSALRGTADAIQYLAIGTLDVGAIAVDEATGNYRTAVAVTGEVLSVERRGASVAQVGPVTMIGEGPTRMVARNNALKAAARRAASDLVAKLSARDIR